MSLQILDVPLTAKEVSKYFSSFRKSEQVVVYNSAIKDFDVLADGVLLHLNGLARGTIFETYDLGRLGLWVGWCFPRSLAGLERKIDAELSQGKVPATKRQIFIAFGEGLRTGKAKGQRKLDETKNKKKIDFRKVSPTFS